MIAFFCRIRKKYIYSPSTLTKIKRQFLGFLPAFRYWLRSYLATHSCFCNCHERCFCCISNFQEILTSSSSCVAIDIPINFDCFGTILFPDRVSFLNDDYPTIITKLNTLNKGIKMTFNYAW